MPHKKSFIKECCKKLLITFLLKTTIIHSVDSSKSLVLSGEVLIFTSSQAWIIFCQMKPENLTKSSVVGRSIFFLVRSVDFISYLTFLETNSVQSDL